MLGEGEGLAEVNVLEKNLGETLMYLKCLLHCCMYREMDLKCDSVGFISTGAFPSYI